MPDRLPEINLLPDYRREGSAPSILFFIFVALIIIAFIVMGHLYSMTQSNLDRGTSEENQLTDKTDSLELQKATLETDDDSRYEQAVAFAQNYAIPTSVLISEIDHLLPDESYLREYN